MISGCGGRRCGPVCVRRLRRGGCRAGSADSWQCRDGRRRCGLHRPLPYPARPATGRARPCSGRAGRGARLIEGTGLCAGLWAPIAVLSARQAIRSRAELGGACRIAGFLLDSEPGSCSRFERLPVCGGARQRLLRLGVGKPAYLRRCDDPHDGRSSDARLPGYLVLILIALPATTFAIFFLAAWADYLRGGGSAGTSTESNSFEPVDGAG